MLPGPHSRWQSGQAGQLKAGAQLQGGQGAEDARNTTPVDSPRASSATAARAAACVRWSSPRGLRGASLSKGGGRQRSPCGRSLFAHCFPF
eukprot:7869205-Pyramimonas_sp.AAC.1